eukprot:gnl/MRDRNA2_/MRDRNA2_108353_c0_seq1.p1 gnl/MRDRNA2_/MRDRNA2_108353_c0~~gnl/MRDRNA2_/MRDRNA2_108353_c0_seq1.p1  ORF type:complete len:453 (-),score=110.46 gnl/MRDRNA2_/MRDRNA2_108353_c0_seq1:7-1365(-)
MQKLTLALCITTVAAAPWPFSMWRGASSEIPPLPDFYHTTPSMELEVNQLAQTCKGLTVKTISDGEVHIQVAKYTAPGTSAQYKTMVVAGEHAREMIGSEVTLNFVKALCGQAPAADIEAAKKDTEFLVVVNANPGSRTLVEKGSYCTRMNPNHVDINRNFDVNRKYVDVNDKDTNPGKQPFDQPESRMLKKLLENFMPHAYLDLHSGFKGMFLPNALANDEQMATKLQRLTAPVDEAACKCPLGIANTEVGYHTAGSALDYSFSILKVPFAMAMEVYIDSEAKTEIEAIENRWNDQKGELLKPIATGSSFMENGVSANKVFPLKFINSGDDSKLEGLDSPGFCLRYFNPVQKSDFDETLKTWTNALAQLSIKSREVPANAAIETMKKPQIYNMREIVKEMPAGDSPVWFALKCLGLLLAIYVGVKYYKVKQGKSPEQTPLSAQMTPVQVSD